MSGAFQLLTDPAAWAALATLIAMEVVLGIDNLVFVAVLSNRVAAPSRARARLIGLGLALVFRLALLASVVAVARLTQPLFEAFDHAFSPRDLILLAGGLFLVWKATSEIGAQVDPDAEGEGEKSSKPLGLAAAIGQIIVLDLIFSIDSIITAVGMTDHLAIMIVAVVVAIGIMIVTVAPLSAFLERNPTVIMLALSFLVMIGMTLIADGFGFHVPKGYIYVAMLFSGGVEALNAAARSARRRRNRRDVKRLK